MTQIHAKPMTDHKLPPFAVKLVSRALALALLLTTPVMAQTAKDTVRWDDRASQWVYTLFNPADLSRYKEVRYTPRTLIEPVVKSKVQWDKDLYEYSYRVKNGGSARQPISSISVQAPKWDAEAIKHAPLPPGLTGPQLVAIGRAEVAAEDAFVAKTLYSPNRWESFLNVNSPTRVVFGWLVDYQKGYSGIAPRTAKNGFSVLRAELPGVGWIFFKGYTPDLYNAASLPRAGAVADQVEQVHREDSVDVPVLVPAIVLPKPYNGAELARRLKAHVATWPDVGLMDADSLAAVSPKLDALINALNVNDKKAARAAANAIQAEVRRHHPGMGDANTDDDDDAHDSKTNKRKFISDRGALEEATEPGFPIHRVAARALTFDLKYLLARMESAH